MEKLKNRMIASSKAHNTIRHMQLSCLEFIPKPSDRENPESWTAAQNAVLRVPKGQYSVTLNKLPRTHISCWRHGDLRNVEIGRLECLCKLLVPIVGNLCALPAALTV